jgi:hypothetical protein
MKCSTAYGFIMLDTFGHSLAFNVKNPQIAIFTCGVNVLFLLPEAAYSCNVTLKIIVK